MRQIKNALRSADPLQALQQVVLDLSEKGMKKAQIFKLFQDFLDSMQGNEFTEVDEDYIIQILDMLQGFTEPALLADEDIE
ncbi:hypothetical protein GF342_00215 [Candidatus Woesearchaeota archaeon]|nr:hypothetical protein [Candidatus Woesearchaeota archaeon]